MCLTVYFERLCLRRSQGHSPALFEKLRRIPIEETWENQVALVYGVICSRRSRSSRFGKFVNQQLSMYLCYAYLKSNLSEVATGILRDLPDGISAFEPLQLRQDMEYV